MRRYPLYGCLLFELLCNMPRALAAETSMDTVRAAVTYMSAALLYINAGRSDRVEPGTTGTIIQQEKIIGRMEVVFAADHSSSCRVTESTADIQTGDSVNVFVAAQPSLPPVDSAEVVQIATPAQKSITGLKPVPRNQVSARVAVQSYLFHDRSAGGRDDVQPAVVMNGAVRNVGGSHLSLMLRARSRQVDQPSLRDGTSRKRWDHRVYEMALVYDHPASRVQASLGRLRAGEMSGMGEVDGLLLTYGRKRGFRSGVFYGRQPHSNTSSIHSDLAKGGVLAVYEHDSGVRRFGSTIALSGEYHRGSINREFAYVQTHWTVNHSIAFYQNAEINFYRGWRKSAEGKTLELTNVLVNAVWSPFTALTTTFGYDARTNYRTYETRSQPDSLFDTQLWQGLSASADVRLPWRMTAGVSGGLRQHAGDAETVRNGSFALAINDPLGTQILLTARANVFRNASTSGEQPSLGMSRRLFLKWQLGVQAGQDRYHVRNENRSVQSNWLHVSCDYDISRFSYASAYAEYYRGGGQNTDRFLLEVGFRY